MLELLDVFVAMQGETATVEESTDVAAVHRERGGGEGPYRGETDWRRLLALRYYQARACDPFFSPRA